MLLNLPKVLLNVKFARGLFQKALTALCQAKTNPSREGSPDKALGE
jgi:hypothetical protein